MIERKELIGVRARYKKRLVDEERLQPFVGKHSSTTEGFISQHSEIGLFGHREALTEAYMVTVCFRNGLISYTGLEQATHHISIGR